MLSPEQGEQFIAAIEWGVLAFPLIMALTKKQRDAIIKRDDGESQMRHYSEEKGWFRRTPKNCPYCGGRGCGLEAHHITTQRNGGMDAPDNLITLNRCEHTGKNANGQFVNDIDFVVHPDIERATKQYRKGNKHSYIDMARDRNNLIQEGEVYWNTDHDAEMLETAHERTLAAAILGWIFPQKK